MLEESETTIHPRRDAARIWVLPVTWPGYFRNGGFVVASDRVLLRTVFGRLRECPRSAVAEVLIAQLPRFDYRVLLLDGAGGILMQDRGLYYSDDELARLASVIGVGFRSERVSSYRDLRDRHPDISRHWWMKRPYEAAIVLTVLFLAITLAVVALANH